MFVRHICKIEIWIYLCPEVKYNNYVMITYMQTLLTHCYINFSMSWEEFTESNSRHLKLK